MTDAAYVASIANPPRVTRVRRRIRIRSRKSGSGMSKFAGTPPWYISLGSESGLIIAEDR